MESLNRKYENFMKKLLLLTTLSICSLSYAMDEYYRQVILGSAQNIVLALQKKGFEQLAHDTLLIKSLADRTVTYGLVDHIIFHAIHDKAVMQRFRINSKKNIIIIISDADVQNATQAVMSTSIPVKPATPNPHPTTLLATPLAKL